MAKVNKIQKTTRKKLILIYVLVVVSIGVTAPQLKLK